jgi:tetratricopeptide (TPR) repeat protein
MKVFLSYGHDHNAPLVAQITRDLQAAGHVVWIDTAEIKAGDQWRRSIVDGLSDTDWTLGFLSRHSTRQPGVCLDELAIALHVKGGTIATILLEAEKEVGPPISMSHIQWLDMHDWAARQAAGDAAWYQGKIAEILALLASPTTQHFAGEIENLDRLLKPITQEADIGLLADGFVGRQWLRDRLETWRRVELQSRLFWLTGAPGSGKSAFAAWLAHYGKVSVLGLNLCRYNVEDRRDPGRVLRTIAFQIATRLPDYRRLLLDRLLRQDPDGNELARKSPAALFDWLLAEPLRFGIDGGRTDDRYLVVIDALDETIRDGRSELAEVLAESVPKLPSWISLLVTSRPELPIVRQFSGFQPQTIDAGAPENLDDLRRFTRDWLASRLQGQAETDALVEQVVAASAGNFLYLRKLREAVDAGFLPLSDTQALPRGLVGLYERWFRRQFSDVAAFERLVPLLEVLIAAQQAVPEVWLARIFGWSKREQARMLEQLGSLFERRPEGVTAFHKSLRDWLVDEQSAGADFVIDAESGAQRLCRSLWEAFRAWAKAGDAAPLDGFCARELSWQILHGTQAMALELARAAGPWAALWEDLLRVGEQLSAHTAALSWWRMAARLAELTGGPARRQHTFALHRAGDISRTLGRREEAKEAYRTSLVLARSLMAEDAQNPEARHALFAALLREGNMAMIEGHVAKALEAYGEASAIVRGLREQAPDNAEWQRNFFVSLERLGDARAALGDHAAALAAYREGAAILGAMQPSDTSLRRDAAVNASKIGDMLMDGGDTEGALASYRAALAITRAVSAEAPASSAGQRDVYAHLSRIGDALMARGELAGALEAYGEGLQVMRALVAQDPSHVEWRRDLHIALIKRSDILRANSDLAGALAAAQESLAIARALAASDRGNAEWQRDVVVSLMELGDVHRAQGDRAGAIAAFEEGLALAAQDPGRADRREDIVLLLWGLAALDERPREHWSEAAAILTELKAQNRATAAQLAWIDIIAENIAKLPPPD